MNIRDRLDQYKQEFEELEAYQYPRKRKVRNPDPLETPDDVWEDNSHE